MTPRKHGSIHVNKIRNTPNKGADMYKPDRPVQAFRTSKENEAKIISSAKKLKISKADFLERAALQLIQELK